MTFFWIGKGLTQNKTKISCFQEPRLRKLEPALTFLLQSCGGSLEVNGNVSWVAYWKSTMAKGVCGGYSALDFRQWVPDEIHLDVSLKCGVEQLCEVTCPTPCVRTLCLTLSFSALCPVALCTSSDGASTATLGQPSHPWIEPSLKKVALVFSPSFPFCNYIPFLSALSLPVTPSSAFPSSVCLHLCLGRVFDPQSFLLSLSFAYSCLVLQEPL